MKLFRRKKKPVLKCDYNHKTGEYTCKDEKGKILVKGKCKRQPQGREGGGSIVGTGVNYGRSKTKIKCDDSYDIRKTLKKKYKGHEIEFEN